MTPENLPTLNAALNATAAICLWMGYRAIHAGKKDSHKKWMLSALACSGAFLTSYLYYHFTVKLVTPYTGTGFLTPVLSGQSAVIQVGRGGHN